METISLLFFFSALLSYSLLIFRIAYTIARAAYQPDSAATARISRRALLFILAPTDLHPQSDPIIISQPQPPGAQALRAYFKSLCPLFLIDIAHTHIHIHREKERKGHTQSKHRSPLSPSLPFDSPLLPSPPPPPPPPPFIPIFPFLLAMRPRRSFSGRHTRAPSPRRLPPLLLLLLLLPLCGSVAAAHGSAAEESAASRPLSLYVRRGSEAYDALATYSKVREGQKESDECHLDFSAAASFVLLVEREGGRGRER